MEMGWLKKKGGTSIIMSFEHMGTRMADFKAILDEQFHNKLRGDGEDTIRGHRRTFEFVETKQIDYRIKIRNVRTICQSS